MIQLRLIIERGMDKETFELAKVLDCLNNNKIEYDLEPPRVFVTKETIGDATYVRTRELDKKEMDFKYWKEKENLFLKQERILKLIKGLKRKRDTNHFTEMEVRNLLETLEEQIKEES